LLHDQPAGTRVHARNRSQHHQVQPVVGGVAGNGGAPTLAHHLDQEMVGLLAALVGRQVIGTIEVDRIDLVRRHELRNGNGLGRLFLHGLEFFGGEGHVLVLGELVALDHVVLLDLLPVLRAHVLLLQPGAVLLVQPVEGHRGRGL